MIDADLFPKEITVGLSPNKEEPSNPWLDASVALNDRIVQVNETERFGVYRLCGFVVVTNASTVVEEMA